MTRRCSLIIFFFLTAKMLLAMETPRLQIEGMKLLCSQPIIEKGCLGMAADLGTYVDELKGDIVVKKNENCIFSIKRHAASSCCSISADGQRFAIWDNPWSDPMGTCGIYSVKDAELVNEFPIAEPLAIAVSSTLAPVVALSYSQGKILVRDIENSAQTEIQINGSVTSLALSPEARFLAVGIRERVFLSAVELQYNWEPCAFHLKIFDIKNQKEALSFGIDKPITFLAYYDKPDSLTQSNIILSIGGGDQSDHFMFTIKAR